jgi:hypothetical protein
MKQEQRIVTRCAWCVSRVGAYSYFLAGRFQFVSSSDFPKATLFSDGMCPLCEQKELSDFLVQPDLEQNVSEAA